MREFVKHLYNCIVLVLLCALFLAGLSYYGITVQATKKSEEIAGQIGDAQSGISDTQAQISAINDRVSDMEDKQDLIEEELADVEAELINMISEIGLKEDEIAEKEDQISEKKTQISDKETDILRTSEAYEEAVNRERKQYDDMILRIRAMYENSDADMLTMLLNGHGLGELLNRMEFIEEVYSYDRQKMTEYTQTRQLVLALWNQLEQEKLGLEEQKADLENEQEQLQLAKADLEDQKAELDVMQKQLEKTSKDYETKIKKAQQEAAAAKATLKQQQQELKRLQEAQKAALAEEAAAASGGSASSAVAATYPTVTTSTDYNAVIDAAAGSDLGKQVAKYACQYIGYPYVYGGNSLTQGTDCSGFTSLIYASYGYKLSRTSYGQRSNGVAVDYSQAQPGDIICYSGHVAMYIGGGLIVHASNPSSGIKVSKATYRSIITVRRIIQ